MPVGVVLHILQSIRPGRSAPAFSRRTSLRKAAKSNGTARRPAPSAEKPAPIDGLAGYSAFSLVSPVRMRMTLAIG